MSRALVVDPATVRGGPVRSPLARPAPLQPQLEVGRMDDPAEHEAERLAAEALRSPAPATRLQRCACGGITGADGECAQCRARRLGLQRAAATSSARAGVVPPVVHEALATSGRPLESPVRGFFEARLGLDLSAVRIHDDARAAESAAAVGALAYTVGSNVVFGAGRYAPGTRAGDRLLAHELVHVAQQRAAPGPLRRDLARPPLGPGAAVRVLTPDEVNDAIAFDQARFSDPYSIRVIRDVLGLEPVPAVVDEELVQAVVEWQAERRETQDGKIGHVTTRSIVLELIAERQLRDAVMLIIDSYGLLTSLALDDVTIGTGAACCGATGTADAVTHGGVCPPAGTPVRVCICRTSFPPHVDYNHFVRIVGHEMVHVPHCATAAALNLDLTEFEAFFFEACARGRAPALTPAQRVNHANIALAHFAALPAADQTAARIAMRNQLQALVAAGGVGAC